MAEVVSYVLGFCRCLVFVNVEVLQLFYVSEDHGRLSKKDTPNYVRHLRAKLVFKHFPKVDLTGVLLDVLHHYSHIANWAE
jgi:hypothetical protein